MFLEKLDIIIAVFAAVVVGIVSVIGGLVLIDLAIRLIITIIVFYFIGFSIKMYLRGSVFKNKDRDTIEKNIINEEDDLEDDEEELIFESDEEK